MVEAVVGSLSAANLLLGCALAIVAAVLALGVCVGLSATAGSLVLARSSGGCRWVLGLAALTVGIGLASLAVAV